MLDITTLTEDTILEVASYLSVTDLLCFECTSTYVSRLDTAQIWKARCEERWRPWPRYLLTPERQIELETAFPDCSWKHHFLRVEQEATSLEIKPSDLRNLNWFLSFSQSGVRGELRSDFMQVYFQESALLVPGYPALTYEIINDAPPSMICETLHKSQLGDQPFSTKQWLKIANFPPHIITKRLSNAEWIIANRNVTMVSCQRGKRPGSSKSTS
mmetsp:Transcript_26009/g.39373  ORF Transcript_26009/g.39373 Transcript_26009/m.39373 type:complete len:215 (-) Transcript_26009:58-702(-)